MEPRPFPSYSPLAASLVCLPVRALRKIIFLTVLSTIVFRLAMEALEGGWNIKKIFACKKIPPLKPRVKASARSIPRILRENWTPFQKVEGSFIFVGCNGLRQWHLPKSS